MTTVWCFLTVCTTIRGAQLAEQGNDWWLCSLAFGTLFLRLAIGSLV